MAAEAQRTHPVAATNTIGLAAIPRDCARSCPALHAVGSVLGVGWDRDGMRDGMQDGMRDWMQDGIKEGFWKGCGMG